MFPRGRLRAHLAGTTQLAFPCGLRWGCNPLALALGLRASHRLGRDGLLAHLPEPRTPSGPAATCAASKGRTYNRTRPSRRSLLKKTLQAGGRPHMRKRGGGRPLAASAYFSGAGWPRFGNPAKGFQVEILTRCPTRVVHAEVFSFPG